MPTVHTGKTLTSTTVSMKLYQRHTLSSVINAANILLMWAGQYLKNTLQLKFRNNDELARVLEETLEISVTLSTAILLEN
jgi:hypothetical protein